MAGDAEFAAPDSLTQWEDLCGDARATSRPWNQVVSDAQRAFSLYKPAWYQPYTILPVGALTIVAAWLLVRGLPAVLVTGAVWLWWYVVLIEYPVFVLNQNSDASR